MAAIPDQGMPGDDLPAQPAQDDLLAAYSAGYTHADVAEATGSEPPRPDIGEIWGGTHPADATWSMTPEEDRLQDFGPRPNAPSISDQDIALGNALSPVDRAAEASPTAVTAAGADPNQLIKREDSMIPGTGDKELTGETAPWEVPETRRGKAGILNLSHEPNAGKAQDI